MIITDFDIDKKRTDFDEEIRQGAIPLHETPNIIGNLTQFFFALTAPDGSSGIGAVEARILKITPPDSREEKPFLVDLAVPTHVRGLYAEVLNVSVYSITLEDPAGGTRGGICRSDDLDIVREVMDAKFKPVNKPGLQLVVNNSDK